MTRPMGYRVKAASDEVRLHVAHRPRVDSAISMTPVPPLDDYNAMDRLSEDQTRPPSADDRLWPHVVARASRDRG